MKLDPNEYAIGGAKSPRITPDSIRVLRELGRTELAESWEYKLSQL